MRREVGIPFSCEEFTYIDSQGYLWVTLTFGFSHSQSVPWSFCSLFKYIRKIGRLFTFPPLFIYMENLFFLYPPNEDKISNSLNLIFTKLILQ